MGSETRLDPLPQTHKKKITQLLRRLLLRLLSLLLLLRVGNLALRDDGRLVLLPLTAPPQFDVSVELLQDVHGVVDDQCQPGQSKENPRGNEDAVPIWVVLVRVAVCERRYTTESSA